MLRPVSFLLAAACSALSSLYVYAAWTHVELAINPELRDGALLRTLDSLVENQGDCGEFYVNAEEEKQATFAVNLLTWYANDQHKGHRLSFKSLPGNFFEVQLPDQVDTIQLKYPAKPILAGLQKWKHRGRLAYFADKARSAFTIKARDFKPATYAGFVNGIVITPLDGKKIYQVQTSEAFKELKQSRDEYLSPFGRDEASSS